MTTTFGYARVSSTDQNEDRQIIALQKAGVEQGNIFVDHRSGKDFKRPQWMKMRRKLQRGDLLVVTSIDRFGRCYEDIINEWRMLVKNKGVNIKVLDMPLLDTTAAQGLLSEFIGDLVLQILSFVAQSEREHIKTRQREGIAAAKLRGVKFGRPSFARPEGLKEMFAEIAEGTLTIADVARECKVSRTTIRRWMGEEDGSGGKSLISQNHGTPCGRHGSPPSRDTEVVDEMRPSDA